MKFKDTYDKFMNESIFKPPSHDEVKRRNHEHYIHILDDAMEQPGFDVNQFIDIYENDEEALRQETPLYFSVQNGLDDMVDIFLKYPEIDVNLGNFIEYTPLMAAVSLGNMVLVQRLVAHPGLEINRQDEAGFTALHWAREFKEEEIAEYLEKHGATE
jgi:ankyrin repeat protein